MGDLGKEMYLLIRELFPICRSITGDGVRETLRIIKKHIPLKINEVPSGTKVLDWEIPDEWNIKDAYVKDENGNRVIDFQKSNLHIVSYSIPFQGKINLNELKEHIYTLPDQPDLIPYVTSYYEKRWGFCLSHNDYLKLKDEIYEVKIDSNLEPGSLTYGELFIKGIIDKEIFLSTYICHPSMANNELSGPVVTTYLSKHILSKKGKPYYSYRILFIPERIGSLTYLHFNLQRLKERVIGGYVVTCVGDPGCFSYLQTREENRLTDRVTLHVLKHKTKHFNLYDFLDRGSDEIQYNYPGVDLNIGSLTKTKYGKYPEYHTSGDNLEFVTPEALVDSLQMYKLCLLVFENNHKYINTKICEPQLGKRRLIPTLSTKKGYPIQTLISNFFAYCNGDNDLVWIADKINYPVWELFPIVAKLLKENLIERIDEQANLPLNLP